MTYNKPGGITYTDMAIWVDEHAYKSDRNDELLYQYLYHLVLMLANQSAYYTTAEEYDQFALFSATRLFLRLTNSKQFEVNESGTPKMKPIKSILNYIKKILYPYKVDFELEFNIENKELDVISTGGFDLGTHIQENSSLFDQLSFSFTVDGVASIVRAHLKKIPYKQRSAEWMNIYISCMLTLLDSITLSNYQIKEFKKLKTPKSEMLERLYTELRYNDPILFHLDKSMSNYIKILVNELRHVIAAELSWKEHYYITPNTTMKNLICTNLDLEDDS